MAGMIISADIYNKYFGYKDLPVSAVNIDRMDKVSWIKGWTKRPTSAEVLHFKVCFKD